VDGRAVFSCEQDRGTYLKLLRSNLLESQVRLLAWCLMTNHVHLIAIPEREDSLALLLRRVQGRYAQYFNIRAGRTGHLWQNRFFACVLGPSHLWAALRYVENNPVRAGIVDSAGHYVWSSARAHLSGIDDRAILDMSWWDRESGAVDWAAALACDDGNAAEQLRSCTYAGRPFGSAGFVSEMSRHFGRYWVRGRPKQELDAKAETAERLIFPEENENRSA
jgi:putative transposase